MPNAQHCERNEVTRITRGRESEACIVVMVTSLDAVGVAVDGGMERRRGDELKRNVRTTPRTYGTATTRRMDSISYVVSLACMIS